MPTTAAIATTTTTLWLLGRNYRIIVLGCKPRGTTLEPLFDSTTGKGRVVAVVARGGGKAMELMDLNEMDALTLD